MDSHDIFGGIIVIIFAASLLISTAFMVIDYRNFNAIVNQCTNSGFIQNDKIRIICSPEKAEKAS